MNKLGLTSLSIGVLLVASVFVIAAFTAQPSIAADDAVAYEDVDRASNLVLTSRVLPVHHVQFSQLLRRLAGTVQPGFACTSHNDCAYGQCACGRGTTTSLCCHLTSGQSCYDSSECQSGICFNGKCQTNGAGGDNRFPGAGCSVDQDCQSGSCSVTSPTGLKCA